MSKVSDNHPNVGALVCDETRKRIGVFMGMAGPFAMLRPVGGGKEWEVMPEDVREMTGDHDHA
ncbi:hypothetical protein [Streptomyces millisiae]|uniref:Uncharacterized protein n=1 Tax=Streptomyces millisiae TaxID=3075542 RepID=A0ABU2LX49_9ACTN|nr:hypothetical protein [Streptomyces sp. DSM 44918]MDT0322141.1 hypothetical protein [Streptomyces sp. DSM 44918]